jgi:lipopolysaccharide transport system ATP-binding protein
MTNKIITIQNLGKRYNISHQGRGYQTLRDKILSIPGRLIGKGQQREEFWALKDISFEIEAGDRVGIIGRNGAGKSTLLKILSRITKPTSGRAVINGRVASLLEVGTGFHPELTGRENIFMNGALLGMTRSEIKRKFDEIVDFAEVEKFIDTPVKRYSSGMYVRLAFAVAAHLEPEILIIDEVLAVGDAQFQKKCLGKMEDVSKGQGRTVLFVSHSMAAIQQLCTKGIILRKGTVGYSGIASDAVNRYIGENELNSNLVSDGYIDLESLREKNIGTSLFKKMRILNANGNYSDKFKLKESMVIEVELENHGLSNIDYGIVLKNGIGQRITSFATWMYRDQTVKIAKKIIVEIPSIQMVAGTYYIRLAAARHSCGEMIDVIDNAAVFIVESVDIFSSGVEFTSEYGVIIPSGTLRVI